jgi:RNA polymerase sigma-70 factor (ECF subfamily)
VKREPETIDTDPALVRGAAAGDERAFSRLAASIRPRMYRWALVHTLDADAAEDVTQRALTRLHQALPGFRGDAAFSTWAYVIVRRAAADWQRSERRRTALHMRHGGAEARSTEQRHDMSRDTGLIDIVRAQLVHLPARQRAVFDLIDLQNVPPHAAATLLSMNPATARVHLMRARRALRARLLKEHGPLVENRQ